MIDANILLQGIVPDVVGAADRGFRLGQNIKQAPLRNQLLEQQAQQGGQAIASGEIDQGQKFAAAVHSVFGDTPADQITPEMFQQGVAALDALGAPLDAEDRIFSPDNAAFAASLSQAGKRARLGARRLQRSIDLGDGKIQLIYDDGSIEVKGVNEVDQSIVDAAQADKAAQKGREAKAKADAEAQAKADAVQKQADAEAAASGTTATTKAEQQQAIEDVKTSNISEQEKERALGSGRAKIKLDIKNAVQTANRSKPNLIVLQNALKAIKTGKIAQARNMVGSFIPGVADVDTQTFISLASKYTLDELSRQSGTKTDFDFEKAEETQARLGNTAEANEAIIQIALDSMNRTIEEGRQFDAHVKGGGLEEDFIFSLDDDDGKKGEGKRGGGTLGNIPLTNAKGWGLQADAVGNRAYVSPDGTQFEEVR